MHVTNFWWRDDQLQIDVSPLLEIRFRKKKLWVTAMMAFPRPVVFISVNCVAGTAAQNLLLVTTIVICITSTYFHHQLRGATHLVTRGCFVSDSVPPRVFFTVAREGRPFEVNYMCDLCSFSEKKSVAIWNAVQPKCSRHRIHSPYLKTVIAPQALLWEQPKP